MKSKKIEPGSDIHFALLGVPWGFNFLTGQDYENVMAFARTVWDAAQADEPMLMALCESQSVVLREGQPYVFRPVGDCETCAAMSAASREAYGEPPAPQPTRVAQKPLTDEQSADICEAAWTAAEQETADGACVKEEWARYGMHVLHATERACAAAWGVPLAAQKQAEPSCGNGCSCLAQCGDVYAHSTESADAEDAARYRWLRAQPNDTSAPRIDVVLWEREDDSANSGTGLRGAELDRAVDTARGKVGAGLKISASNHLPAALQDAVDGEGSEL